MTKKAIAKQNDLQIRFNGKCAKCKKAIGGRKAEYHHCQSDTKLYNMANIWATSKEEEEKKKCIALCKPCHNRLHKIYGADVTLSDTKNFLK